MNLMKQKGSKKNSCKGYSQKEGVDYQETFSPVIKMRTMRIILAFVAFYHWYVYQMDVYNAFLQGDPHNEIYIKLPQEFHSKGQGK